ncbi:BF3164 family lipoprotein [Sphingobacterium sp. UT-1RO-CII-1]|uniref:BF3164 family lipoprotein n=1 Tax=Sphingobacterium sp. UT-1RO-CII-1 TaxID=2995225 RepID=UPI00227D131F|nr:BF3164 family lipoprotein [Sphingobacterium sp. UT-1RO-CII-1]MCY4778299.1 BF3164 family lipoprotein [Sphingobacterium sp. UT-1RO-CII-1]
MHRTTFILILILFGACNKSQELTIQYHEDNTATESLTGKEVPISIELLMPNKVVVIDSHLIIYDPSGEDMFHVFKLPKIEFSYSFGSKGQGPDEFANIDPFSIKELDGKLTFLDNNKIVKIELKSDKALISKIHPIVMGKNPINRINLLNDSIYIADMLEGQYEHHKVNLYTGKELTKFGRYPKEEPSIINDIDRYQSYKKANTRNSNKLGVFYLYHDRMKIYHNETLIVESKTDKNNQQVNHNNPTIYRVEPMSTDSFIYTLYIGKKKNEINFTTFTPQLEVWNWDGKLKSKYLLDKPIISFFISEKFKKIYATTIEHTDKIYVFDMPNMSQKQKKDYKKIENDLYTIEIPNLFTYTTTSPEVDKNRITEYNGRYYNSCYFAIPPYTSNTIPFKGSLEIIVSYPMLEKHITVKDFVHNRYRQIKENAIKYDTTSTIINNKNTLIHKSITQHTDPKGKKSTLTSQKWIWQEEGKIIEIGYGSTEDFDENIDKIANIVASFVLKD